MKRIRNVVAGLLLAAIAALPLPGCVGQGPNPMGSLAGAALSIGASVGTYLLIKELD